MSGIQIKIGKFDDNCADLFAKIDGEWGRVGWVESDLVCTFSASSASGDEWRVGEYLATLFNPGDSVEEIRVDLFALQGRRLERVMTAPQAKRTIKRKVASAIEHNPAAYVAA